MKYKYNREGTERSLQPMSLQSSLEQVQSILLKGHACVCCRKRKMKCDGARPTCSQCERANRVDECEYLNPNNRSKVEILEEDIARLQKRLRKLENPRAKSPESPILLHDPYAQSSRGPGTLISTLQDLPANQISALVDRFLPYAPEFGFFLNPPRFRTSALLPETLGHPRRPCPALLTVVCLWGIRLSGPNSPFAEHEPLFLSRALERTTSSLSGSHPQRVLHTVQAEILLGQYFFSIGKLLEAKYHITSALSIGVCGGLNKIRSNQPPSPLSLVGVSLLPPLADSVEEGERIYACWTGFSVDKCWAAAFDSSSNMICPTEIPGAQTDTPWPLEMEEYEQGGHPPDAKYCFTSRNFLSGEPTTDIGDSTMALFAKASVLWERANDLAKEQCSTPEQYTALKKAVNFRRVLIEDFMNTLTPLDMLRNPTPTKRSRLLQAHSIAHAALITVIGIFKTEEARRVSSAQAILDIVSTTDLGHYEHINPVMGSVWALASYVLIDDIRAVENREISYERQTNSLAGLQRALPVMNTFASSSTFMRYQLDKIQEAYSSIQQLW